MKNEQNSEEWHLGGYTPRGAHGVLVQDGGGTKWLVFPGIWSRRVNVQLVAEGSVVFSDVRLFKTVAAAKAYVASAKDFGVAESVDAATEGGK